MRLLHMSRRRTRKAKRGGVAWRKALTAVGSVLTSKPTAYQRNRLSIQTPSHLVPRASTLPYPLTPTVDAYDRVMREADYDITNRWSHTQTENTMNVGGLFEVVEAPKGKIQTTLNLLCDIAVTQFLNHLAKAQGVQRTLEQKTLLFRPVAHSIEFIEAIRSNIEIDQGAAFQRNTIQHILETQPLSWGDVQRGLDWFVKRKKAYLQSKKGKEDTDYNTKWRRLTPCLETTAAFLKDAIDYGKNEAESISGNHCVF